MSATMATSLPAKGEISALVSNRKKYSVMEKWVKKSLEITECDTQSSEEDIQDLISRIFDAHKLATNPTTSIALVGGSGHGKSSLINALVDGSVVTASSMRASTSVPTEIIWNASTDPQKKFIAEIEFLSKSDWEQEVDECLQKIQEEIDSDQTVNVETSEAYAKISSVYPSVDVLNLKYENRAQVLQAVDLSAYLGKTEQISEPGITKFRQEIANFTDASNLSESEEQPTSLFPLIRVVRVYIKAKILNAGLVLIDLPGVGDSNAARNAVAQKYIHNADHVFVIAKIVRAVTDGTAKELLGEHFQKRLVMTGKYNGDFVSFIATCTDDIAVDDTIRALKNSPGVSPEFKDIIARKDATVREFEELQKRLKTCATRTREVNKKLKEFHKASTPDYSNKKRKHSELQSSNNASTTESLSEEQLIYEKLEEQRNRLEELKKSLKSEESERTKVWVTFKAELRAACIHERNLFTKRRLRQDFESGRRMVRKDLNETSELASKDQGQTQANGPNSPPARLDLNVFCVSSKAYQKMKGRLSWDQKIDGFPSKEHSGVPELQRFCYSLSVARSDDVHQRTLEEFSLLKEATQRFVHGVKNKVKPTKLDNPYGNANSCLNELTKHIQKAIKTVTSTIEDDIQKVLLVELPAAQASAIMEAPKKKKGLPAHALTWKAVCRYHGVFTSSVKVDGARLAFNWNLNYSHLYIDCLWPALQKTFHELATTHCSEVQGALTSGIERLNEMIGTACSARQLPVSCKEVIPRISKSLENVFKTALEKAIWKCRELPARILDALEAFMKRSLCPLYMDAATITCIDSAIKGTVRSRLEASLDKFIEAQIPRIYQEATELIKSELKKSVNDINLHLVVARKLVVKRTKADLTENVRRALAPESTTESLQVLRLRKQLGEQLKNLDAELTAAEASPYDPNAFTTDEGDDVKELDESDCDSLDEKKIKPEELDDDEDFVDFRRLD